VLHTHTSLEQRDRLQAYRFELVARVADDLAHEIRNPLHALVINVEVLKRRLSAGATDTALGRADVIEEEIHRVHGTIDQLLRLLRPEREPGRSVQLGVALEECTALLALQAKLARMDFHAELPEQNHTIAVPAEDLRFALLAMTQCLLTQLAAGAHILVTAAAGPEQVRIEFVGAPFRSAHRSHEEIDAALAFAGELLRPHHGAAARSDAGPETLTLFLDVPVQPA
jgi:signal transduction histidine kinase